MPKKKTEIESTIELRPFVGFDHRGIEIEKDQWNVTVDGKVVGYLPHAEGSRLMPIVNLPDEYWKKIVAECERIRGGTVEPPFAFYVPPQLMTDDEDLE